MSEITLINESIFQLKREILRKQREIDGLKSEILKASKAKKQKKPRFVNVVLNGKVIYQQKIHD